MTAPRKPRKELSPATKISVFGMVLLAMLAVAYLAFFSAFMSPLQAADYAQASTDGPRTEILYSELDNYPSPTYRIEVARNTGDYTRYYAVLVGELSEREAPKSDNQAHLAANYWKLDMVDKP